MPSASLHDIPFEPLGDLLESEGVNRVHALPLWRVLYRGASLDGLPPPLRRWMASEVGEGKRFHLDRLEVEDEIHSEDGLTRKFLLRLEDGQVIETVLMGYEGRHTVCVSSQAGCAMSCVFCATGQMGFVRSLRPGEIVAQVLHARRVLKRFHPEARVRNLVMMGMGEPLDNYEGVMDALSILTEERGIGIGPSKITVSTVGVIPGIQRLAQEKRPYNLAVSLHGSTEEERGALVPASKRWCLEELVEACRAYGQETGKRIFIQWSLIEGENDSIETAERLVNLLQGINVQVNLIPLNPTGGYDGVASPRGKAFQQILLDAGMPCTFRQRRGIDVAAGCGMLKAERGPVGP